MSHAKAKNSQGKPFLLDKATLLALLGGGRREIEETGSLRSMLFTVLSNGKNLISPLEVPDDTKVKYRMFQAIGKIIHSQEGGTIKDAVLLSETWIVNAQEAPDATKYMPSQHPCRQEAIVLVGRNADKTHSAIVIQTFTKNEHNAFVWSEPQVIISDSSTKGLVAAGLLDALFDN